MIEQPSNTPDPTIAAEKRKDPNWVPWTIQQTLRGVLLTLVPWIGFNLLLSLNRGSASINKPLPFGADLAGAIIQLIFTALVEGAFLLAPYYYANRTLIHQELAGRRRQIAEILGLRRFNIVRTLPWIVALLALIVAVNLTYSSIITALHLNVQTNDQVVLQGSKYMPLTTYATLAAAVVIAPFCEEIFFRGFVLTGLLHDLSPIWALVISSALFAIAHADPGSFVPLFAIGLCLGFLRLRTGSTWASISLHMLNNLLSSVLIILAMHSASLTF